MENDHITDEDRVVCLSETDEHGIVTIRTKLQARIYYNRDECVDYITNVNNQKIPLIISSNNAQEILAVTHTLEQIKGIYVLNTAQEKNLEDWINQCKKIKGIFTTVKQLVAKLSYDFRLDDEKIVFNTFTNSTNEGAVSTTISKNVDTSLNLHNTKFMYFHILIDILLKMFDNIDVTSRQEMVNYLKQKYSDDESKRTLTDQLDRDYERTNAIRWYTKDTFLCSLLNKALRDSDFDALFALRTFIVDLYMQLITENQQFCTNNRIHHCDGDFLTVYRGQEISNEELSILRQKQGSYFSMQSFLSTSTNLEVADMFSGGGALHTDRNNEWILYEFKIDTNLKNTKPYAQISHLSQYPQEEEVLITLGAVFHIDNIQFDDVNHRWHATLSLCNNESFDLYGMMQQYAAEIVVDRVSPGFLLYQQGNYVKAREYFQKVLSITSLKESERAHCYRGLGAVAAEENQYDEGYENFRKELDIWQILKDEVCCMEALKNISDMLTYMGKFEEALDYLQIVAAYFKANKYEMEYARIFGMIGYIMGTTKQWKECILCYEIQLEVRERILDRNHEDIGITHANIGVTYARMKNYKEAIEHFEKALNIYRYSHPPDHPNVLKAEENLRNAICSLNEEQ